MTWRLPSVTGRALTGLGLGLWVILITFATLRAQAAGPVWGVQVGASLQGQAIVVGVDPQAAVWARGVRAGDAVLTVDGEDALAFIGQDLSPAVREIVFRDASGAPVGVSPVDLP